MSYPLTSFFPFPFRHPNPSFLIPSYPSSLRCRPLPSCHGILAVLRHDVLGPAILCPAGLIIPLHQLMSQVVPFSPTSLPETIVSCLELIGLFCMTFTSLTPITRSRPLLVASNGRMTNKTFYQMVEILVIIQISDALPRKFIHPCFHHFRTCPHILINLRVLIRTSC